jgi:NADPH:quinone reductase-like Zn-dependent oxidoreductase
MQLAHEIDRTSARIASSDEAMAQTMRAVVHPKYGTPEVLTVGEVPRPTPNDGEVLVRVHAANMSIGDHHVVTGKPYLIRVTPYGGVPRPKNPVPGTALSGVVEAVGANVTDFRIGDAVFGEGLRGAYAEYAVVAADRLTSKPERLSFEEAAATPWGMAALQGLRDTGGLTAGQKVLINGASGGVGSWAVQIAKTLGAHVTAVVSTRNVERMHALGADDVIDYTTTDFVDGGARFDLVFDIVASRSLADFRRVLLPTGTYVSVGGVDGDWLGPIPYILGLMVRSLFTRQKLTSFVVSPNREDLALLGELAESGKARPVIAHTVSLSQAADALREVGEGHSQGQTVLRFNFPMTAVRS